LIRLQLLTKELWFPPVEDAMEDGMLAIGGDLHKDRLLLAYRKGIFPWYDGDIPLWWCPDPRFVLFPDELKISKSMQVLLRRHAFEFTINKAFTEVIHACRITAREGQQGTWINDDVEAAYTALYNDGYAISAEAWQGTTLVGGLYGVRLNNVFFGESMFSHVSNASKYAFISLTQWLQQQGVVMIDCQVYTAHLESLGARMINRKHFIELLEKNT
jgi:leucyl/phenylalanyl-tRNA---protein transferase